MATHSSVLDWEISWAEELGGLLSTGSQELHHSPVHWDDPEGWYGEGGGRGVQDG